MGRRPPISGSQQDTASIRTCAPLTLSRHGAVLCPFEQEKDVWLRCSRSTSQAATTSSPVWTTTTAGASPPDPAATVGV